MSQFQLTTELLKLSRSQNWDEAKLEWELVDIERVEDPETCLCGHYPILEICTIKNRKTNKNADVGNCCVKKFIDKSDKIFRSVAKVRKDSEKSVNAETLDFALNKNWISPKDYGFYMNILRKRGLTEKQLSWKKSINQKIMSRISKSKNT